MTAEQYKQICQRPDVLSRSVIEETARLLPDYSGNLNEILSGVPIQKPALHQGTANADYFRVPFPVRQALEIVEQLLWLEADSAELCSPHVTFIADLIDVWGEIAGV